MKPFIKVVAHLIFTLGVLIFISLPINQYNWLQDIDPSITPPVDDGSGSRTIFTFLLLILIVVTQAAVVMSAANMREKRISVVLIAVAISAWLIRLMV